RATSTHVSRCVEHDDAVIRAARANFGRARSEPGNQAASPALPWQGGARIIELAKLASAERRKFRSNERAARPVGAYRRAHAYTYRLTQIPKPKRQTIFNQQIPKCRRGYLEFESSLEFRTWNLKLRGLSAPRSVQPERLEFLVDMTEMRLERTKFVDLFCR